VFHVLNANVDSTYIQINTSDIKRSIRDIPLGNNSSAHPFVDDNTKSVLGDVVNAASLSVVNFVWHALLDSSVTLRNEPKS
jgi:hypothetical protein